MTLVEPVVTTSSGRCPSCGAPTRGGARYCGTCGAHVEDRLFPRKSRLRTIATWALAITAIAAATAVAVLLIDLNREKTARHAQAVQLQASIDQIQNEVQSLSARNNALGQRIAGTEKSLLQTRAGVAPLAGRILRSVFTIETPTGLGTGWAAWTAQGTTYLITANHVVADAVASGTSQVTVRVPETQFGLSERASAGSSGAHLMLLLAI